VPPSTHVVSRRGEEIRVDAESAPGSWQLELVGVPSVGSIDGGTSEHVDGGTLIRVAAGTTAVVVRV
jgi:hypothetical protein